MKNISIGVVIVTWNSEKDIRACLTSLLEQSIPVNIVVVDNNSADNTVNIVTKEFPIVELIQQDKNYFLCKSNNDGIKHLWLKHNNEFVVALNPDTKLEKKTIETLYNTIKTDDTIAAVGPKVYFWNNKNEGKLNSTGLIFDGFMHGYDRGILEEDTGQYDKQEEMLGLSGVCVMYRSSALKKAGLYWEPLKLYMDDIEIGIRLRKKGFKLMYDPTAKVHHAYMTSTSKMKEGAISKQKMWAWLLIALKHYSFASKLAMVKKYIQYKLSSKK